MENYHFSGPQYFSPIIEFKPFLNKDTSHVSERQAVVDGDGYRRHHVVPFIMLMSNSCVSVILLGLS